MVVIQFCYLDFCQTAVSKAQSGLDMNAVFSIPTTVEKAIVPMSE